MKDQERSHCSPESKRPSSEQTKVYQGIHSVFSNQRDNSCGDKSPAAFPHYYYYYVVDCFMVAERLLIIIAADLGT